MDLLDAHCETPAEAGEGKSEDVREGTSAQGELESGAEEGAHARLVEGEAAVSQPELGEEFAVTAHRRHFKHELEGPHPVGLQHKIDDLNIPRNTDGTAKAGA
jgi:hypothetical protein